MPTLGEIIRAPKASIRIGRWQTGKIPASIFPLKRKGKLPQSSAWQWRVVEFDTLGNSFVLLLRLNSDIEYYSSILAMKSGFEIQIICHHEFHQAHRGWHCHFIPDRVEATFPGVLRDKHKMRLFDSEPSKSGKLVFDVQLNDALRIASQRFRFQAPDESPDQYALL